MIDREAPVPIVDSHAHLDDEAFAGDLDLVVAESRRVGVSQIINIGYKPQSWEASRKLRDCFPGVELAVGFHPMLADEYDLETDRRLLEAVRDLRPVAIGEAGLDFSRPRPAPDVQRFAFRRQIEIALEERLPLVIHQRAAGDALADELDRWPELVPIVLHSFDGNRRLADWAIERDCFIGIGGLATRPRSSLLRELLALFRPDRLVLETDSPYLAPPSALSRRNTPANLPAIASLLSPLWSLDAEELCWQTTRNARKLFRLPIEELPSIQ